ncbi:MAG TPA: type II secretion system protein GspM [Lacipirellulaceae bacterium]|jgi:general secretion pathway protein M|nr:type II secretion system protein GspM [Lacipirellulaceae bacterium]
MKTTNFIKGYLVRFPLGAAFCYGVVVIAFMVTTWIYFFDFLERRQAVAATGEILSHLEGRNPSSSHANANGTASMTGSPVLEGPTVTVAGAALLQRVAGAVTRVGGNILSSQVDLQGAQSKNGFVKVSVDCEVDQPSLQQLLYDLEAGMPLLFVDQLVAQAPEAATSVLRGKMRVSILVSGQWQGAK